MTQTDDEKSKLRERCKVVKIIVAVVVVCGFSPFPSLSLAFSINN
jgi:hypothetical protein